MPEDTPKIDDGDPNTTHSALTRWEYIGTVLSFILVVSLAILTLGAAYGILSLAAIGQAWFTLYSIVVLMAATWTFGKETLEAVQQARDG